MDVKAENNFYNLERNKIIKENIELKNILMNQEQTHRNNIELETDS